MTLGVNFLRRSRRRTTRKVSPQTAEANKKSSIKRYNEKQSKHDTAWAARNQLNAAIHRYQSTEQLLNTLQSDATIQKYLRSIPMESTDPTALTQEEAMREALSHGWVVNGSPPSSFKPSSVHTRSGRRCASIQAARKLCHHMCDLEASFCFDPDDIFRKILHSSSRANTEMDCERSLASVLMLESHRSDVLQLRNTCAARVNDASGQHPVEVAIVSGGNADSVAGSPICCLIRFTYSFQLIRSTTNHHTKSINIVNDNGDDDSDIAAAMTHDNDMDNGLSIYVKDDTIVLSFDAIVSEYFTFRPSGMVDSSRRMEIVVQED
eukprot:CAMPEP_0116042296 /NCGR_PEP_ID=MMETSP0321-20121206/25598_1 /TAXON_ID=163516 /ORGANISM="Leptocylindrus danicus var. danicus, Strain B650" /LENGTH=321 /DNA_ID=CAMNT_0003522731 /DNA_START=101 /DNA_END=1066 /DNA_ORIENTATION=+